MSQSSIFEVAAINKVMPTIVRLPYHIGPAEDETLGSWFAQLSAWFGQSQVMFGRTAFGIDVAETPDWWYRPPITTLLRIARRTGLELVRLENMTYLGLSSALGDEEPDRFAGRRWQLRESTSRPVRRMHFCTQCIAEDGRPYLRRLWMMGWAEVCPRHRTVLTAKCPRCQRAPTLRSLSVRSTAILLVCGSCEAQFGIAVSEAAHPLALGLQSALVTGKQSGTVVLSGLGQMDWATLIAVADALLSMIWQGVTDKQRVCLFDRMAQDTPLSRGDRAELWKASNYSGLLLLAWLFEDLTRRLRDAAAILKAPRFGGMLGSFAAVDDHMGKGRITILAPAFRKSHALRREWREWLDRLPESTATLGRRAAREGYKRRQLYLALAALKDGATVAETAAEIGITPRQIFAMLRRGFEFGLEAALRPPLKKASSPETRNQSGISAPNPVN